MENKEKVNEIIDDKREQIQKLFKENSEKQEVQEIIIRQAELNLKQLKHEEIIINEYANALSVIECYLDKGETQEGRENIKTEHL